MLIAIIIVSVLAVFLLYGRLSHLHLGTSRYEIYTDGRTDDYTFVLLSDLHCCSHGPDNEKLINRIQRIAPDFIFISGDMVTKHLSNDDIRVKRVLSLIRKLSLSYSVYYSPGNHEIRLDNPAEYVEELLHIGVRYVTNEEMFFPDRGIRVYGLDLPLDVYRQKELLTADDIGRYFGKKRANIVIQGIEPEDTFNILIAHDPRHFDAYAEWGADLTLAGHVHGGILRLPFVGGVFSPCFRLFPKYDAGIFDKNGKKMIVSRGLGSHHLKFRWFNSPEIAVIRIKGKK